MGGVGNEETAEVGEARNRTIYHQSPGFQFDRKRWISKRHREGDVGLEGVSL